MTRMIFKNIFIDADIHFYSFSLPVYMFRLLLLFIIVHVIFNSF